jgi:hypothetical protein
LQWLKKVYICYIDSNFGEIEMCLNKRLFYNIRVKSRICDLLIFRKPDFLKLSVNHKSFTERFLKLSLTKYIKIIEETNILVATNEYETDDENNKNNEYIISNPVFTNMKFDSIPSYDSSSDSLKKKSKNNLDSDEENKSLISVNDIQASNDEKDNESEMIKLNAQKLLNQINKLEIKFDKLINPKEIIDELLKTNDFNEKRALMDKLESTVMFALKNYKK